MPKELVISTSPHETRVAILENGHLVEIYVEREKEYALVGSIYKGRVTRVLPGMQSAFVDIGLDSDAFLYVSDVLEEMEEYDQIVSTVEEKVQKMEEQGGQIFSPSAESATGAVEPTEVVDEAVPVTPPQVVPPPRPHVQPPARPPSSPSGGNQGQRPGGEFRDGGRRGGRRRRRGGGGGGQHDERRELPNSKYASPSSPGQGRVPAKEAGSPPRHDSAPRPTSFSAPPADYEPIILPGESLAKYKDRVPGQASQRPAASSTEPAAPALETPAIETGKTMHHDAWGAETESPSVLLHASAIDAGSAPAASIAPSGHEEPHGFEAEEESESPEMGNEDAHPESEMPAHSVQLASDLSPLEPAAGDAHAETHHEDLSETEAAVLFDAAADDAHSAVIDEDEETKLAEAFPEIDEEEGTDAQIREDILEAAGQDAEIPAANGAEELAAHPGSEETAAPSEERTARISHDQRQRMQQPGRQSGPRRGRPQHGRSHDRHQAQRHGQSISDLLKSGQEIIIQIAKEPLGKKGARITSHVALPGRFLVYMPTLQHVGVSRKINSAEDRSRLRHLVTQYNTTFPGGFIVRTAAEAASDEEVRADIEYLGKTWKDVRARAEQRRAPALLHRDLNLIERILRDYFSPDFTSIWVDSQEEYARVLEFVSRVQPSLVNRVKLFTKDAPIFEEFGIQQEIDKALRPKVWLKSGGYIVINHTEALVAIDVNTGKFVGRGSNRLEDTIVKTNVEAVKEIVRQIRLRDLGGIIVLDFIDMEERKNRIKVMQALEEALRDDRAPSKVLPFNEFGLVAITRKRTKQALERALCQPCPYCTGSGMVKSIHTICYEAQAEARKMAAEIDAQSITLRVHPEIAKSLKTRESALIEELERWIKKSVIIHGDPSLHWEQYDIY
jgi:ribonuclease G